MFKAVSSVSIRVGRDEIVLANELIQGNILYYVISKDVLSNEQKRPEIRGNVS